MKILAIVGSLREKSINKQLATKAKEILGDKVEFEILNYNEVPFFNQDIEYPAPKVVSEIRNKVIDADGIWIFTTEYNHYFSGVLKNLIDWLSRPVSDTQGQVLSGKKAALSGAAFGGAGTAIAQDHLVALLSYLNMNIMNSPRLVIPAAYQKIDANGIFNLGDSEEYLRKQADKFIEFISVNK